MIVEEEPMRFDRETLHGPEVLESRPGGSSDDESRAIPVQSRDRQGEAETDSRVKSDLFIPTKGLVSILRSVVPDMEDLAGFRPSFGRGNESTPDRHRRELSDVRVPGTGFQEASKPPLERSKDSG